jgi:hypothetical protein
MGGLGALGAPGAKDSPGGTPAVAPGTPAAAPPATPVAKAPATKAPAAAPGDAKGCPATVDHVFKLALKEITAHAGELPKEAMAMMEVEMAKQKAQVVAECQKGWSAELQQCIRKAGAIADLMQCEALMAGGGEMATEAKPSGDAECDKIGAHVAAVYKKTLPADQAAMYEQVKYTLQNEIAAECAGGSWPKEMRACMLKATSEDQFDDCALAGLEPLDDRDVDLGALDE